MTNLGEEREAREDRALGIIQRFRQSGVEGVARTDYLTDIEHVALPFDVADQILELLHAMPLEEVRRYLAEETRAVRSLQRHGGRHPYFELASGHRRAFHRLARKGVVRIEGEGEAAVVVLVPPEGQQEQARQYQAATEPRHAAHP